MKTVSSLKNPAVQAARALRAARERARQGAFLLEGEHMVGEALAVCPDRVSALFVDEARVEAYAALTALVPQAACYAVPSHVLAAISQVKTPQGVAAVCAMPPSPAPEEMGNRLILLENVQDPGNVGTVLRTLDAAGFDGCILTPGCADPFGPKALRATMGIRWKPYRPSTRRAMPPLRRHWTARTSTAARLCPHACACLSATRAPGSQSRRRTRARTASAFPCVAARNRSMPLWPPPS